MHNRALIFGMSLVLSAVLLMGGCVSKQQVPSEPSTTAPVEKPIPTLEPTTGPELNPPSALEPRQSTTPAPVSTPTPEAKLVKFTDPSDDIFDKSGNPVKDEPYLDVMEAEVSTSGSDYMVRIKLNGPMPAKTPDSQIFLEWDIYVDADNDTSTGSSWPVVTNDLGFEYFARLMLLDSNYLSEVRVFETGKSQKIENKITDNIIELRWPQAFYRTDTFNFIVAAKKYGERGKGSAFMLADKAPNEGHYNFPDGYIQPPQPGLPTVLFESPNATIFYNSGNEDKAKWYVEAFELAYEMIGEQLGVFPQKRFTIYVYISREDFMQGLQEFSGFSPESAAYFSAGGAPRPIDYVLHAPPNMNWHGMIHEYAHTIQEEIGGDVYKSIKWLDEGLADYLAHVTVLQTKYKENEIEWSRSRIKAAKKALEQDKFLGLTSISTGNQWSANHDTPELYDLQYAESYAVVTYIAQEYSIGKGVSILEYMKSGDTQELALQKALQISLAQLEKEVKDYLRQ